MSHFQAVAISRHWGLKVGSERIRVVPSTAGPTLPSTATGIGDDPGDSMVLTAAGLVDYKRPLAWVAVAEQVCATMKEQAPRFEWIGEGPLLEQARSAAARGPAKGRSFFPGLQHNVAPYYDRCSIYLQLSGIETLGLSVLDALRRGIPCVVTDVGGLPELVSHGVNGFVVPLGDNDAAATAIIALLNSASLRSRMGAAAREGYEERFAPTVWETSIEAQHVRATRFVGSDSKL
jgi:glycosyltransferase involved in cell wall biosynthesis